MLGWWDYTEFGCDLEFFSAQFFVKEKGIALNRLDGNF